ncbi:eCIS core domain-containing protein [Streptomyces sp. NPDC054975]
MHDRDNATTATAENGRVTARTPAAASPAQAHVPAAESRVQGQGLLALQRTAGNAAVVQMLRQAGHVTGNAADHVTDQEGHRHGAGCGHGAEQPAVQRSAVHDVLRSGGRPLDDATRTDMESRLGADFSDVRIHDNAAARASADEVGARAYTSGSHVVIGAGGNDRHTLAHELTHVIQQRQGPVSGTDNGSGLRVSDPSDRFEREAEANATRVLSRPPAHVSEGASAHPEPSVSASVPGAAPVQRAAADYRSEFDSASVGTEQELSGVRMAKKKNASSQIAEIWHGKELLLEITTDIGGQEAFGAAGFFDYTLEMKATPAEYENAAAWGLRQRAFRHAVERFNALAREPGGGALVAEKFGEEGEFELKVNIADHKVHATFDRGGVSGSSDQVTLGIAAEDVGTDTEMAKLVATGARWYRSDAGGPLTAELGEPEKAQRVYSYIVSAMTHLAELVERNKLYMDGLAPEVYRNNLFDSPVKNSWGVLPRTPPWDMLNILAAGDRAAVQQAIRQYVPPGISEAVWNAAKAHIITKQSLAGHDQRTPKIGGKQGALFEFRSAVPYELRDAIHRVDGSEWPSSGDRQAPLPEIPEELAKALRRRAGHVSDSDSETDDDW